MGNFQFGKANLFLNTNDQTYPLRTDVPTVNVEKSRILTTVRRKLIYICHLEHCKILTHTYIDKLTKPQHYSKGKWGSSAVHGRMFLVIIVKRLNVHGMPVYRVKRDKKAYK